MNSLDGFPGLDPRRQGLLEARMSGAGADGSAVGAISASGFSSTDSTVRDVSSSLDGVSGGERMLQTPNTLLGSASNPPAPAFAFAAMAAAPAPAAVSDTHLRAHETRNRSA